MCKKVSFAIRAVEIERRFTRNAVEGSRFWRLCEILANVYALPVARVDRVCFIIKRIFDFYRNITVKKQIHIYLHVSQGY